MDVEVLAEELFLDEPLGYGSSVSVEDSCSFTYSSTSNMSPARTLFIMADEKGPDYSSAKSATKMRQLENA